MTCTQCGTSFEPERRGRKRCDRCFSPEARARHREKARRWREANREKTRAATRAWREKNPEQNRAAGRDWRERNRDRIAEQDRERWADPETRAKKQEWYRQWAARNRAKLSHRVVEWQKRNPDMVHARGLRRRARVAGAAVNDFTAGDWNAVLVEHGHKCFYCDAEGVQLEREHVIPLARGGDHTKRNIVPACGPCNRLKATMTSDEFFASKANAA